MITKLDVQEFTNSKGEIVKSGTGILSDETGHINFKLRGEHLNGLKENQTVAFRNGLSILDDECIHLELDKFGKISQETGVTVKVNQGAPNHSN